MRGAVQDAMRSCIAWGTRWLGRALALRHRWRLRRFLATQARLRRRYGVVADTPILGHGAVLQGRLDRLAQAAGAQVQMAETSGSSGTPKRIPYTLARVRMVKGVYIDAFARSFAALDVRRTSLYVFTSLSSDTGLTSMMMAESRDLPPYLSTLQAPYRLHHHPEMAALAARYGAVAMRVWVLALSNPGCLYATNPSTLSVFMDSLSGRWDAARAMVCAWHTDPASFSPVVRRIAGRLAARGAGDRIARIARASTPLGLLEIVPALALFCCWDGGYVRPFLDRIRDRLDGRSVRHLPMYSMSTETVETVPHFGSAGVGFVPLGPGTLVEFLPVGAPVEAASLVASAGLELGQEVSLVVSDAYGLLRYDTEDVFRVHGRVGDAPDLRFLRRRGLGFSFTGEKITGDQVRSALDVVAGGHSWISTVPWLVLIPSQPESDPVPHYRLVVGVHDWDAEVFDRGVAGQFDMALGVQNAEYKDKRASERLGPVRFERMDLARLVRAAGGERHGDSWETQFKFLPLLTQTYEDVFGPVPC